MTTLSEVDVELVVSYREPLSVACPKSAWAALTKHCKLRALHERVTIKLNQRGVMGNLQQPELVWWA
jgi:hypothetical protein